MDKDIAELISITGAKAFGELNAILPFLEEHLSNEEYKCWLNTIESICEDIDQHVSQKIYNEHSDVKKKA